MKHQINANHLQNIDSENLSPQIKNQSDTHSKNKNQHKSTKTN